jgi:tetratricopeptide (TPR) repeat protein
VHASTRARFEEAYRGIADRLELPSRNDPKTDTLKLVKDWLCDELNGRWAMVLDNADDVNVFYPKQKRRRDGSQDTGMPASLAAFLPQSQHGSILVTSRSKDAAARLVGSYKNLKEVRAMNEDQAVQLLRNKLEDASNEDGMVDLIRTLGSIPLAISQAAAYINRGAPRMTISRYLNEFRKNNNNKRTNLLDKDAGDLRRDESASNSVVTTWQMSFEQIREERRSAADLLSLMSFFNPQGIPESVLRSYSLDATSKNNRTIDSDDDNDGKFDDDLDMLRAYSLVTVTAESDMCEMHQLVQFCTGAWLASFNEVEQWRRKFLMLMAREFPVGNFENWTKCQTLLPHVESVSRREPADHGSLGDWAHMLHNAAWYKLTRGSYQEAKSMALNAVRTRERIEGLDGPNTLRSVSVLATVLQNQGKHEQAEEMNRRALEGMEKVLGKDHPDTLRSLSNLASLLQYQGKYEQAEEMNRRALEGREKVLGKEHPDTLRTLNNLASVLRDQGMYKQAEEMNQQALEGMEKVLGKEHYNTLNSVHCLAFLLYKQKRYKPASALYERASSGYERILGLKHPTTVRCSDNYLSLRKEMQDIQDRV